VGEPVANGTEALGNELIATFATVPRFGEQSGIEEDAEMLRHGRPAHLEVDGQPVDGAVAIPQQMEDLPPGGMANGGEDGLFVLLVVVDADHGWMIGKYFLTRQGAMVEGTSSRLLKYSNLGAMAVAAVCERQCFPRMHGSPPTVVTTDRRSEWGVANLKTICTSHVERCNLTIRTLIKRFTRLTICF